MARYWSPPFPILLEAEFPVGTDARVLAFCRMQTARADDVEKVAILWIGDVPRFNVAFRSENEIEPFLARMELFTGYPVRRPRPFRLPYTRDRSTQTLWDPK